MATATTTKATPTLHHKRTLSSLNRPSPGTPSTTNLNQPSPAASSPERAQKRARFDASNITSSDVKPASTPREEANGAEEKKKSGGVEWMLRQIKTMQSQYNESIVASILIMQHKAYSRKFRLPSKSIPLHLQQRLDHTWAAYECTRRHIESYLMQCAEYNATPSKPLPSTLPPPPSIPTSGGELATPTPILPSASPVPLSAASMIAFDPNKPSSGTIVFPNGGGPDGTGELDLGSMGIDELNAIINGNNFDFANIPTPSMTTPAPASGIGVGGTPAPGGGVTAMTPNTQAETDRLIASLASITEPTNNTPSNATFTGAVPASSTTETPGGGDDVDTLLARLAKNTEEESSGTDNNFQFDFSTDLGDLDLSNLSDLAGFFDNTNPTVGDSTENAPDNLVPTTVPSSSTAAVPSQVQDTSTTTEQTKPSSVTESAADPPKPQAEKAEENPTANLTGLENLLPTGTVEKPAAEEGLDLFDSTLDYGLDEGINMDDFDFGDGEIPNVDGEDFDAMFKDFQ